MKKKRNVLLSAALAAAMTASLAACGDQSVSSTTAAAESAATEAGDASQAESGSADSSSEGAADSIVTEQTDLTFIFADGDEGAKKAMNEIVNRFNETYDMITVTIEPGTG